jgi:hypothetical protein
MLLMRQTGTLFPYDATYAKHAQGAHQDNLLSNMHNFKLWHKQAKTAHTGWHPGKLQVLYGK